MKVLVVGDVHWSSYSSIVRGRGREFSYRLENLVNTINWVEQIAQENGCSDIVYLGDFFDKSSLNSEEITALKNIQWNNNSYHYFLVGNHELGISTLQYSSAHLFLQSENAEVVDHPYSIDFDNNIQYCFLPYIFENGRASIEEYFGKTNKNRIIFSHNDIKGIQLGKFVSQEGFSISDIEDNCRIFFNGHLHNESLFGKNGINVGNVSGQNFSEDAMKYRHKIVLLDTDTFEVTWIENPYALNFYHFNSVGIDINRGEHELSSMRPNAVVNLKVCENEKEKYKEIVENLDNIVTYRFLVCSEPQVTGHNDSNDFKDVGIDYLDKFEKFVRDTIGSDEVVLEELQGVLRR